MAVPVTLEGLVRTVETLRRKDDNSVMGSKLRIFSEPDGDPIDVMAWDRDFPAADAHALYRAEVELLVDVSPRMFRGVPQLEATLRAVKSAVATEPAETA